MLPRYRIFIPVFCFLAWSEKALSGISSPRIQTTAHPLLSTATLSLTSTLRKFQWLLFSGKKAPEELTLQKQFFSVVIVVLFFKLNVKVIEGIRLQFFRVLSSPACTIPLKCRLYLSIWATYTVSFAAALSWSKTRPSFHSCWDSFSSSFSSSSFRWV